MVEVRQVRVLPKGASSAADNNGMGDMSPSTSGAPMSSGYGGGMDTMSGMSGMGAANNAPAEPFPWI